MPLVTSASVLTNCSYRFVSGRFFLNVAPGTCDQNLYVRNERTPALGIKVCNFVSEALVILVSEFHVSPV